MGTRGGTFGNAEVEGFSGAPTLDVGAALVGMLAAAIGVAARRGGGRWSLTAAAVSVVAVTVWWQDAKFGALANALVIAAVLAAPRIPDVAH